MTTLLAGDESGRIEVHHTSADGAKPDEAAANLVKILDAVSIPIVVVRSDFVVACANRAATDALNIAPSNIGRSPLSIAVLSGLHDLEKRCAEVIRTVVPTQHNLRAGDKSFIIHIAPYANGDISGTLLTFINVTAFRASIDQAIYEREYAKTILNTMPDPLVVLDADLRVLTANRAFYSMLRISREAIQGVSLNELGNGALDLPRLVTQLKQMLAEGGAFEAFEIERAWPEFGRRTMSLYACPVLVQVRSAPIALLSFHDVTARKLAETTNARLAAIVESSDDAIVTKDLGGIISSWNKGAERIFGYAADEVIGQPITLLIPADRQSEEIDIIERVRRGERVNTFDTVRRRKDGSLVAISVTISPLRDPAGTIMGASKIARDITERKRAEEAQRLLAYEVDHRSKNLLALVQATVHFSKADSPAAMKAAIEGRIQALSNVHTLLAESRWAGADLRRLVTDELSPYWPQGTSRAEIDGPDLILQPQSAQLITMVLHELTTNAVKYGALSVSPGRVRIEWSHSANGKLVLRWAERDGPPVKPPAREGFGTRVLDRAIRSQLNGELRFDWRPAGLVCEIEVDT